jgi:yersiniabactin nonribosomal peptide synthetase
LGVLAAGGVYVPVGVDQPVARRELIFASAGVRCVVSGADVERVAGVAPLPGPVPVDEDAVAYVIYTSGSTGVPKGVEVSHRSAVNTVVDVNERFGVGAADRVLAVSALDFDLSVYDLFGLLGVGGSVVLVGQQDRREAAVWLQLVCRHRVTVWNSVPALLEMALAAGQGVAGWADSLRLVLLSGDWVGLELPDRLRAQCPRARLIALGGATEAAVWSNFQPVERVPAWWRSVPYGRPLRNQMFRVLDGRGRDCPDWVAGELWIGGLGVARGYRNDPARTAAHFRQVDGVRWYRTGDLGRYWPDGTLEFLGRRDLQVKVGGHRIELGEIEAVLLSHPRISAAVAVTIGHPARRLAAAVTATGPLEAAGLHQFLTHRLPGYMIPDPIRFLEALPLTANGKIDRTTISHRLSQPTTHPDTPEHPDTAEHPTGPIETTLATIWTDLLDTTPIHRHHNFFTLGGDSLLATQLVAEIRRRLAAPVTLRQLLDAPTVAELAELVAAGVPPMDPGQFEEGEV